MAELPLLLHRTWRPSPPSARYRSHLCKLAMGRTGRGRGGRGRHDRHTENEATWTARPFNRHQNQTQPSGGVGSVDPPLPSTSHQQGSGPIFNFGDKNRRNQRRSSRNRRGFGDKPQILEKSELGSSISDVGPLESEVGSLNIEDRAEEKGKKLEEEDGKGQDGCVSEAKNEVIEENFEEPDFGAGEDDVQSILEALSLSVEEPVLSEEQLRINDQLQEDELLAMESIYGDNAFILDRQRELRSFEISIHIEFPEEITVTTMLNASSDNLDGFSYSFKVQYLPPIVLTCLLPKTYPSHLQPHFTISVRWLDSARISNLCTMLDSIWMEQPGQEVIYQWVEWLQNSSFSYLGFDKELLLGPYGAKQMEDKRAVSGIISPDIDVPSLRSYNDDQRNENFSKNLHECCICYSECAGTEFVRLPCQHFFCWKCMKTYSDMHVTEGTINKLLCPEVKCGGMVPPGLLKRLLGDEEFERWESMTLQKSLESMADVAYCPRCETPCIEDEKDHAQCSKCFFSFCTLCRERRHVGVECMTPELRLKFLKERQNSALVKGQQKRKEREMINELLSITEIFRDAKQCPSCKTAISRTEGCNKMVCGNCGQYFCYRCGKAITGYDHFKEGTCELFPHAMIRDWEVRVNAQQEMRRIQAELLADNGHYCPFCRQINIKMGNNNHIFCWACQVHYCYLCRKLVRRSSQHFGPKGCKQHTVG